MSYLQASSGSRKSIGILVAVALHIAFFAALLAGLARKASEAVQAPLAVRIIAEAKSAEKPPAPLPPPPKSAAPKPVFVPRPEVRRPNVQQAPEAETVSIAMSEAGPVEEESAESGPASQPAAAEAAPQGTLTPPPNFAAVFDRSKDCAPQYPRESQMREETGITTLSFLIDVDGHPLAGKIERSSGHRRLDEAARKALMDCRYKPAIVAGHAVQAWGRLEFEWKLE
jgi:protein TonB